MEGLQLGLTCQPTKPNPTASCKETGVLGCRIIGEKQLYKKCAQVPGPHDGLNFVVGPGTQGFVCLFV